MERGRKELGEAQGPRRTKVKAEKSGGRKTREQSLSCFSKTAQGGQSFPPQGHGGPARCSRVMGPAFRGHGDAGWRGSTLPEPGLPRIRAESLLPFLHRYLASPPRFQECGDIRVPLFRFCTVWGPPSSPRSAGLNSVLSAIGGAAPEALTLSPVGGGHTSPDTLPMTLARL